MSERVETVVLDSEGLSAWIAQDRKVLATPQVFHDMGADDMTRICGDQVRAFPL